MEKVTKPIVLNETFSEKLATTNDFLSSIAQSCETISAHGPKVTTGTSADGSTTITVENKDGTITTKLVDGTARASVNTLSARMDTFTSLPEGSTSGNAELADIRVGADGTTYDTAGNAVRGQISELKSDIDELRTKDVANLLTKLTPTENWYIDPSNGVGRTLGQFFSFLNIDVSELQGKTLYSYSSKKSELYSSRTVAFYDSNGAWISPSITTDANNSIIGFIIPSNAITCSVCFSYENLDLKEKPERYYLSKNKDVIDKIALKENVSINYSQIKNTPTIPTKTSGLQNDSGFITADEIPRNSYSVQKIRKPIIIFTFDDGLPTHLTLADVFRGYGWRCGFAFPASQINNGTRGTDFLELQNDGFEILAHSTDGTGMDDDSVDVATIEAKFKNSLEQLKAFGFDVKGWVTPNTWLLDKYLPALSKYYEYGFGHLYSSTTTYVHKMFDQDIRQLDRINLDGNTIEQSKAFVDNVVNNNGLAIFYAHNYPSTNGQSFTEENFKVLLDYIKSYEYDGKVQVLTPYEAINEYYAIRHSDLLELYNK